MMESFSRGLDSLRMIGEVEKIIKGMIFAIEYYHHMSNPSPVLRNEGHSSGLMWRSSLPSPASSTVSKIISTPKYRHPAPGTRKSYMRSPQLQA